MASIVRSPVGRPSVRSGVHAMGTGPVWRGRSLAAALAALAALAACSGGGDPAPSERLVELSWTPNRERGVNAPGGGYLVEIGGSTLDVPYVSGDLAPTFVTTTLWTGRHTVTVRAYAALDAAGGTGGSVSAPSQALVVDVP